MIPRLFLPEGQHLPEPGGTVALSSADAAYLCQVLRRRPGDAVVVLDRAGRVARAVLSDAPGRLRIEELLPAPARGGPRVTLLVGLLKGEKLDLVIQKATELGVARVVPVPCARAVRRPSSFDEEARAERRRARWERIATAAAQQCRRPDVPHIAEVTTLTAALADTAGLRLLLWEDPAAPPLRQVVPAVLPDEITVLVGPEGGFTAEEVALARGAGFVPCGLGPRVLRAETAALAILAILTFLGD
jgi:16S rRNA (uracil1498-N3)-methyltransferase